MPHAATPRIGSECNAGVYNSSGQVANEYQIALELIDLDLFAKHMAKSPHGTGRGAPELEMSKVAEGIPLATIQ
jgi:hypothetical protein